MLNIFKLLECINTNIELNEAYIMVPSKRSDYDKMLNFASARGSSGTKLLVRTNEQGHSGNRISHATSVKVVTPHHTYEIMIPTKAYDSAKDSYTESMSEFMKNKELDATVRSVVRSFIYDNQMAIIAYWYHGTANDDIGKELVNLMTINMRVSEYIRNTVTKPKTQQELDADKEDLNAHFRQFLHDDNYNFYFGR